MVLFIILLYCFSEIVYISFSQVENIASRWERSIQECGQFARKLMGLLILASKREKKLFLPSRFETELPIVK